MAVNAIQLAMPFAARRWWLVKRDDAAARALVDGELSGGVPHYSRQTPGAKDFLPNGKTMVLLTECRRATWAAVENLDPIGNLRWRCTIFRNENAGLSSDLIREATALTYEYWQRHYGARPPVPFRTEVNPAKVRRKRDPGRCFLRAGWRIVDEDCGKRHLIILEAPAEVGTAASAAACSAT